MIQSSYQSYANSMQTHWNRKTGTFCIGADTKSNYLHKELKANEGANRRTWRGTGKLTGSSWIKLHYSQIVLI
jgi:hypothetical protein